MTFWHRVTLAVLGGFGLLVYMHDVDMTYCDRVAVLFLIVALLLAVTEKDK